MVCVGLHFVLSEGIRFTVFFFCGFDLVLPFMSKKLTHWNSMVQKKKKKKIRETKTLWGSWSASNNVLLSLMLYLNLLLEVSVLQHQPPFPGFIPCHYDARLRPKGDICPDQAAVVILGVQITDPSPSLLDDGLPEK